MFLVFAEVVFVYQLTMWRLVKSLKGKQKTWQTNSSECEGDIILPTVWPPDHWETTAGCAAKETQHSEPREALQLHSTSTWEQTAQKLRASAITHAHTQRSITLNWFPSATNGAWVEPLYICQLKPGGEREMKKIERQAHKKRRFDPERVYHRRAQIKLARTKDNTDITSDNKTRSGHLPFLGCDAHKNRFPSTPTAS